MKLSTQPDKKVKEVGFYEAVNFLDQNDPDKVSDLTKKVEVYALEPDHIELEKSMSGDPQYRIKLSASDNASEQMLEDGSLDGYLSGSVDTGTYVEFEGDEI